MEATAIAGAISAAKTAADALSGQSSNADVAAAEALVTAAHAAITGATHASASDTASSLEMIAAVRTTVATAKAAVAARIAADNALAGRIADQKAALTAAAGMVDTSGLTTSDAIAAANMAIADLEAALAAAVDVSDADKAMYQSQVAAAKMDVADAVSALALDGRQMAQRDAISSAVTMARTAVAGVDNDSTDSEVALADAAIAALKAAIENAVDIADGSEVASARGTLATLEPQLATAKTARMEAKDAADKAAAAARAKTGKALYAALAGTGENTNALSNLASDTATFNDAGSLVIDGAANAGALTTDPASAILKAGASVGSLGGWMGMDYAHTDTGTKIKNEARVYTNRSAPTSKAFTSVHTLDDATAGTINVSETAEIALVGGSAFAHTGTQNHPKNASGEAAFITRGTYDGAPGQYKCTGDTCSSTNDGSGAPSALVGTWTFKPDAGAMVSQPDANYLYFGWWVIKDKDGGPTAASAFARVKGDVDGSDSTTAAGSALSGSATYAGKAAGKFAMSNPLTGTGNGGHFTADATLTATFGSGSDAGMTGTVNNFMLNDTESANWSVELKKATWGGEGAFSAIDGNDDTVWSINGNKASASGAWSGNMYDELPGNAPDGDGNNTPTTVTGTFYSEFSTIGRMVGAFGANKQ